MSMFVEDNQLVGIVEDGGRRAIILFETNDCCVGPIFLKVEDVSYFGPSPAINRLIVISHDAQIAMILCNRFDDAILRAVGILVFVDQNVIEF